MLDDDSYVQIGVDLDDPQTKKALQNNAKRERERELKVMYHIRALIHYHTHACL